MCRFHLGFHYHLNLNLNQVHTLGKVPTLYSAFNPLTPILSVKNVLFLSFNLFIKYSRGLKGWLSMINQ